jgi:hypothetical protein
MGTWLNPSRALARIGQKQPLSTMGQDKSKPDVLPARAISQDWLFSYEKTWGAGVIVRLHYP